MADSELEKLRAQITDIDDRLFTALIERARVARKIGEFKRTHGVSQANVYQPERENALIDALIARDHAPLPDSWLKRHYREIFSICRALQKDQEHSGAGEQATSRGGEGIQGYSRGQILEIFSGKKVAFLGPLGTYSHEAVKTMFSAHTDNSVIYGANEAIGSVNLLEFPSIDKVFDAVKSGRAHAAVIPVANSTTGTIAEHFHRVIEEDLHVFAELKNPIQHCLWSKDKNMKLAEIGIVQGHDQALRQCEMWMFKHIGPKPIASIVRKLHESSSEALREIQSESPYLNPPLIYSGGGDECSSSGAKRRPERLGRAAIAGPDAGTAYGLHKIYENIQDKTDNETTFWALCARDWLPPPSEKIRPEHSRTHLICFLRNSPGSLYRLTDLFFKRNLNMSSIRSFRNNILRLPSDSASSNAATSGDYEHVFQVEVDGAFDHGLLIAEAANQGLLVLWLGTTAGELR